MSTSVAGERQTTKCRPRLVLVGKLDQDRSGVNHCGRYTTPANWVTWFKWSWDYKPWLWGFVKWTSWMSTPVAGERQATKCRPRLVLVGKLDWDRSGVNRCGCYTTPANWATWFKWSWDYKPWLLGFVKMDLSDVNTCGTGETSDQVPTLAGACGET